MSYEEKLLGPQMGNKDVMLDKEPVNTSQTFEERRVASEKRRVQEQPMNTDEL